MNAARELILYATVVEVALTTCNTSVAPHADSPALRCESSAGLQSLSAEELLELDAAAISRKLQGELRMASVMERPLSVRLARLQRRA